MRQGQSQHIDYAFISLPLCIECIQTQTIITSVNINRGNIVNTSKDKARNGTVMALLLMKQKVLLQKRYEVN
jgi:hypothetical protein